MKAVAVIGPSQSGKTALVRGLSGIDGRQSDTIELYGGSSFTQFQFMEQHWAAIEVPGGQDAIAFVEPVLATCDAALLCLSAQVDASVLAAPYLRILDEADIPAFLFLNKIDVATDRVAEIVASLQEYCGRSIVLRQVPLRDGGAITGFIDLISERAWAYQPGQRSALVEIPSAMEDREVEARDGLLESLSDFDDALLQQIIEDKKPSAVKIYETARITLQRHDLVPTFLGAAASGHGLRRMLKSLRHEVPSVENLRRRCDLDETCLVAAPLADHRKHIGKRCLVRSLVNGLSSNSRLGGDQIGTLTHPDGKEKVSKVLLPGAFALTIKTDQVSPGHYWSEEGSDPFPRWSKAVPFVKRLLLPEHDKNEGKLASAVQRLGEIDAGLLVTQDENSGATLVSGMGQRHLKAVVDRLEQDFGIEVSCEVPQAPLQETIRSKTTVRHRHRKQSGGAGQFAEVVIEVGPAQQGSALVFEEKVKGGAVPRNFFPAIESGVLEAMLSGPNGYQVVDLRVVLIDGKTHSVDSSDLAFRTAAKVAVREALELAGCRVLQPIASVEVSVPSFYAGTLVQLFNSLKGQVLGFEADQNAKGWDVFRAMLPLSKEDELSRALSSATRGTAWFSSVLDHYEELHGASSVVPAE